MSPVTEAVESEQSSPSSMITSPAEEYICLKVKDVLGMTTLDLKRLVYPVDATFKNLFDDTAEAFGMNVEDFDLTYQEKMDLYELSAMPSHERLTAANLLPSRQKEYAITLSTRSRRNKKKYLQSISCNLERSLDLPANTNDDMLLDDETSEGGRFVGLKNKTMTCYLNSAIQGLWFTPQFRNLIYSFNPQNGSGNRKSICRPLQQIFLLLQFSARDAIETDELTRTFGWTDRDTWQQHDIQELCSLLMEMLTAEFKSTPQDGLINSLYFGFLADYVKCLECHNIRHKPEEFLILPLPIRKPNRKQLDEPTLEEALRIFTIPELLDGNNQYRCEKCDKPVDAHKGYLFKKLPCIFSVQLKRFDSDWETNRRYKLNDKIVFPVALDMNKFMDTSDLSGPQDASCMNLELLKPSPNSDVMRTSHSRPGVMLTDENQTRKRLADSCRVVDLGSNKDDVIKTLQQMKNENGPNVYELFGVFVHRGGLAGGHYYAYIRDFETYRWYRCDDAMVRKARVEDVTATFGDPEDTEQMSAYMLMYRRYDEDSVLPFLRSELPPHILETLDVIVENDRKSKEDDVIEKKTIKMIVKYKQYNSWEISSEELVLPKFESIGDISHFIFKKFYPDFPLPPSDHTRVCRYDLDLGIIENSFDDSTQNLSYCLKNPPPKAKNEALILEVKNETDVFPRYCAEDLVFITLLTDSALAKVDKWEEFHAETGHTIGDLRRNICSKWKIAEASFHMAVQWNDTILPLSDDAIILSSLVSSKINRLYVEAISNSDVPKWLEFVTCFVNITEYNIQVQHLPSSYPGGNDFFNLNGIDIRLEVALSGPDESIRMLTKNTANGESNVKILSLGSDTLNCSPELKEDIIEADKDKALAIDSRIVETTIITVHTSLSAMEEDLIPIVINVDCRATLSTLSRALQEIFSVPETSYCFFSLRDNEETEIQDYSRRIQNVLCQGDNLRVRFCRRLQPYEGRVSVFLLKIDDVTDPGNGNYLGDAILHPNMSLQEAKRAVLEQCSDFLPENIAFDSWRLRRKLASNRVSKIFRDDILVSEWLTRISDAEIYLQILEDKAPILDRDTFSVMARIWSPSEWTLNPPFEFTVFHDHSHEVPALLFEKLLELTDIPADSIEIARVELPYPFALNPVAIQELDWFAPGSSTKPMYLYNDELVIFARSKSCIPRQWTLEEETMYRKEYEREQYGTPPKRETGIRINLNLSKSPSSR
ncbi:ubiquitin carboxyl-terminal hydrolase 47 isoform X2 [Folsomia candida]|uniref:ubiquitin carboxyl-terminal hydrolase 47 isoform X2 n=1 Tax=Folsomia candida TaxID=158441 RepID=UPI001604FE3D|nr:ubiquitin carboxyl-terminal hydrolase 47 isoform X2 [Folsomia candida]